MADYSGQQFGNYRVISLIGHGGFADVYLGEHIYLKVQVALKVLAATVSDQTELDSFLKEAQTVARLIHPHIIRVTDFGVTHDIPFLVMDYAPGGTLRQRHPYGTRLPLPTILSYVRQLADALQYAHNQRLIHRDVKPENMLVGSRNEILLSDFGIALIAQTSLYQNVLEMVGTAPYMAPEQIQGKPHPSSDQYALAVAVYEWLTGERPFQGSFLEIATQHVLATPPPLREKQSTISPEVEEVVLTALAKDPTQRLKSVQAFANALEQAAALAPASSSPQPSSLTQREPAPSLLTPASEATPPLPVQLEPAPAPSTPVSEATPFPPIQLEPVPASQKSSPAINMPSTEVHTPHPALASSSDMTVLSSMPAKPTTTAPELKQDPISKGPGPFAMKLRGNFGRPQIVVLVLGLLFYTGSNIIINSLYHADNSFVTNSLSILNESIPVGIILAGLVLTFPLFVSVITGPLAGLLTAVLGLFLGALLAGYSTFTEYYNGSWTLFVGQALTCFIAGLAFSTTGKQHKTALSMTLVFVLGFLGIIVGTAFTAYGNIPVKSMDPSEAATAFSWLALPALFDPFLVLLLLVIYNRIASRKAVTNA